MSRESKKPGEGEEKHLKRKTVNTRAIIKITTFITQMFALNFAYSAAPCQFALAAAGACGMLLIRCSLSGETFALPFSELVTPPAKSSSHKAMWNFSASTKIAHRDGVEAKKDFLAKQNFE